MLDNKIKIIYNVRVTMFDIINTKYYITFHSKNSYGASLDSSSYI